VGHSLDKLLIGAGRQEEVLCGGVILPHKQVRGRRLELEGK
jgi:hypothetical protein